MTTTVIPERVVPGRRLGRHVDHDPRSLAYGFAAPAVPLRAVVWRRYGNAFDQGSIGSCTGQALTGVLNTVPFHVTGTKLKTETDALAIYSAATVIDGFPGTYPPDDTGSSGNAVCKAAKAAGLISGYQWAFGITEALQALMHGPVITGVNWYECLPADQRVLTDDLRWTPIQKLQPGDGVIGFDEHARFASCYRRAKVTSNDTIIRNVVEVETDRGRVVTSDGHLFVRCHPKEGRSWARADDLTPGDRLAFFMDPYERDDSWEAGYLAGFFDGEGCVSGGRVDVAQVPGPTLERVIAIAAAKGYEVNLQLKRPAQANWQEVHNMYVGGGYAGALRFLGHIRPERLLAKAGTLWEGKSTRSRRSSPVTVQSVKPLGREEVYAIGTTERTLIVEGLLSHNSFDKPNADGVIDIRGEIRGGHEFEVNGYNPKTHLVRCWNSWGSRWGVGGRFYLGVYTWDVLLSQRGDVTIPVPV